MKSIRLFIGPILILAILLSVQIVQAQSSEDEGYKALTVAEQFFKSMKARQYPEIWKNLSLKSREVIVDSVRKDALRGGFEYSSDQIRIDFSIGGMLSRTYWNSFLAAFDPDMALEHSRWDLKRADSRTAEIHLLYKTSNHPAVLKMFKEQGEWKVGWEETFGVRKWFLR